MASDDPEIFEPSRFVISHSRICESRNGRYTARAPIGHCDYLEGEKHVWRSAIHHISISTLGHHQIEFMKSDEEIDIIQGFGLTHFEGMRVNGWGREGVPFMIGLSVGLTHNLSTRMLLLPELPNQGPKNTWAHNEQITLPPSTGWSFFSRSRCHGSKALPANGSAV